MRRAFIPFFILILSCFFIFAASPGGDQALLDQGIQLKNEGKYVEAFDTLSSIKVEFPNSELLPAAEYHMGLSTLYVGRPVEAALQFQRVISKYPASPEAKLALELNGLLYRLYIVPATNKAIYVQDTRYSGTITDLDEPVGLGIDTAGTLYLADRGKKVLYTFDRDGRLTNSTTVLSPYHVTVTPKNEVLIGNGTSLYITTRDPISFARVNSETQARMGYLEEVRSAAVNSKGLYYVVSGKTPGVFVYDSGGNPVPRPGLGRSEEYEKVMIDSRNNIYLLTRRGDSLQVFDPEGKALFTVTKTGKELTFGKIQDFAVDSANHIYLLTTGPKGIGIYSPEGKFLKYIPTEKTSPIPLDDPKVIAVSSAGSIYILDKGTKRIVKIG